MYQCCVHSFIHVTTFESIVGLPAAPSHHQPRASGRQSQNDADVTAAAADDDSSDDDGDGDGDAFHRNSGSLVNLSSVRYYEDDEDEYGPTSLPACFGQQHQGAKGKKRYEYVLG